MGSESVQMKVPKLLVTFDNTGPQIAEVILVHSHIQHGAGRALSSPAPGPKSTMWMEKCFHVRWGGLMALQPLSIRNKIKQKLKMQICRCKEIFNPSFQKIRQGPLGQANNYTVKWAVFLMGISGLLGLKH